MTKSSFYESRVRYRIFVPSGLNVSSSAHNCWRVKGGTDGEAGGALALPLLLFEGIAPPHFLDPLSERVLTLGRAAVGYVLLCGLTLHLEDSSTTLQYVIMCVHRHLMAALVCQSDEEQFL